MILGYARVSTTGQSVELQTDSLRAAGAEKVFAEKVSGAKADREALQEALNALQPGDVLVATKLDRLARSTQDFLNIADRVTKLGAGIRLINQPLIDTTKKDPMARAMMQLIAVFAELEREMILERTSEGRQKAKANGVQFGRKHKLSSHQKQEAIKLREQGWSLADISKLFNVSYQTIGRL